MYIGEWVQNLIHKLEVGAGRRVLWSAVLTLVVVALVVLFDLRAYRNFSTPEAMDTAQLARNIAEGKGYTTLFIRPLSLYLVQKNNEARQADTPVSAGADFAQIQAPHPDLANPPVYPMVLAGLMKVLPFHFDVEMKKSFWSDGGRFLRYQPDFLIAVFNEMLLLAVVALTFFVARKLFDPAVAWLSALLVLGCALLWRFSVSGLSTLLLMIIFLGLTWCVLKIEELAREPQPRLEWLFALAAAAGVLGGVGALTRYAFGWVIIPLEVFLILFGGQRRVWQAAAALGAFAMVLTPWVIRNWMVSGTPFGTAGYAIAEGSTFPGTVLERSTHPDLTYAFLLKPIIHKLLGNLRGIFESDLPKLGGSWAGMFFLTGLMLGFRSVAARRMRYFLLMCLGTFVVFQALGQTWLSVESPEVNSENLIVLTVPLVFIYGGVFFMTLLRQMKLPATQLHYAVIALFVAVSCLPMIFSICAPKTLPVAYPPYYP
ncbi:MAG: glycosyltransferase family 39 protein, partial [Verrucomicrobiia bacterium]